MTTAKYKRIKVKTPGVRCVEHPTRKNGAVRKDRYYTIRYRLDGKVKEEGIGWESMGNTEAIAAERLHDLKMAHRTGIGLRTMAERRRAQKEKAKNEEAARIQREREQTTFTAIFNKYYKQATQNKNFKTCRLEIGLFNEWLNPLIGSLPMKDTSPFILEKLKKQMSDAGRAPRTITYALALVRQVFNYAKNNDLYNGDNPVAKVKKPSEDNRRSRFLSQEESITLLEELSKVSSTAHDIALVSLRCGLRAGEIFKLTWNDVDFRNETILIKDTKSGRNRNAIMTQDIRDMLERRRSLNASGLVFLSRTGEKIAQAPDAFERTVGRLGFNKGVTDRRQKVVFHTLRHTYASWLVMSGVDLYTVQRLMGHSTISITERYSHLAPDHLKKAVSLMEKNIAANAL
ncbi:MAG: site-specific integrase [Holosporales bacterium]|jgi:integrase|nr:site-specific integrase [Holosporales bacterium]